MTDEQAKSQKLSSQEAISRYFEREGGRQIAQIELEALAPGEVRELAERCAEALGAALEP